MSAAAAQLRSDHVNLLIFRYLQESGFENAAQALASDWRRPAEYRDPETYPFAPAVQRNELVSVIQNGLHHDDLLARKCNKERRFKWTGIDARDSIERRDGQLENGAASRPPSSKGRKGRPAAMRPPNDFPTPAPKRQRRSEGSETNVNGDAMDVDGASASADADEDAEAASPAVQSEPEPMEVVERYDSMDVATQTDIKTNPKTTTIYWKVDKPDSTIDYSIWNPSADPKNSNSLLTFGKSMCRFYQVPDTMDDVGQISHADIPAVPTGATVTAGAWRPDGRAVLYAIDGLSNPEDSDSNTSQALIEHSVDGTSTTFQSGPLLLDPVPITTALHYSPNGEYLLAVKTNLGRGLVQVWKTPKPDSDARKTSREPIAWHIFASRVADTVWTEDDNFLVAGESGLASAFQIDANHQNAAAAPMAGIMATHGLIPRNSNIINASYNWEKVSFDRRHKIMVFASMQIRKMILAPVTDATQPTTDANAEINLPDELTALAFKPWTKPDDEAAAAADREAPSLLAAGFADGTCTIYHVSRTAEGAAKCIELAALTLSDGAAAAVAWSPSGEQLAVGNGELVQIWTADSLKRKNGVRHMPEASVVWKPASENGAATEEQEESEPSLSWSADGESLAFAAENQLAVIRFRPPFCSSSTTDGQDVDMNGGHSPTSHNPKEQHSPSIENDATTSEQPGRLATAGDERLATELGTATQPPSVKTFVCSICSHHFHHKEPRKRQVLLQEAEFSCADCDNTFAREDALTRHQRFHCAGVPTRSHPSSHGSGKSSGSFWLVSGPRCTFARRRQQQKCTPLFGCIGRKIWNGLNHEDRTTANRSHVLLEISGCDWDRACALHGDEECCRLRNELRDEREDAYGTIALARCASRSSPQDSGIMSEEQQSSSSDDEHHDSGMGSEQRSSYETLSDELQSTVSSDDSNTSIFESASDGEETTSDEEDEDDDHGETGRARVTRSSRQSAFSDSGTRARQSDVASGSTPPPLETQADNDDHPLSEQSKTASLGIVSPPSLHVDDPDEPVVTLAASKSPVRRKGTAVMKKAPKIKPQY